MKPFTSSQVNQEFFSQVDFPERQWWVCIPKASRGGLCILYSSIRETLSCQSAVLLSRSSFCFPPLSLLDRSLWRAFALQLYFKQFMNTYEKQKNWCFPTFSHLTSAAILWGRYYSRLIEEESAAQEASAKIPLVTQLISSHLSCDLNWDLTHTHFFLLQHAAQASRECWPGAYVCPALHPQRYSAVWSMSLLGGFCVFWNCWIPMKFLDSLKTHSRWERERVRDSGSGGREGKKLTCMELLLYPR